LNILRRLNRELGADLDLNSFRHRASWNSRGLQIEMHLESSREQMAFIEAAELEVHFVKNETIHTESSHKFSDESIRRLLWDSNSEIERTWKDGRGWYAVTLARPNETKDDL
jgi:L-histidine N-alpha-methyltransferase